MKTLKKSDILLVLLVVILVIAVDQYTKQLILIHFSRGEVVSIIPGLFNLTLRFNPGAAFSLMADLSDGIRQVALGITTLVALGCVVFFLFKDYFNDRIAHAALAMILGGAFGNLLDRFLIGEVVDFLDFYISRYHWPVFNVADSCICVGVFILLLRQPKKKAVSKP